MNVVFGSGHVLGYKIWKGYNEDEMMLDLARRKARYAIGTYEGIQSSVMFVTGIASYQGIEDFIRSAKADICSLEHSNADPKGDSSANRVTIYRTVINPGDGPCKIIGAEVAKILGTVLYPTAHAANSKGNDAYGAIGRAMKAGCSDAWLAENGFHTHPATRKKLSDPDIRQQIAEATVDAMAGYYKWVRKDNPMDIYCKKGDGRETNISFSEEVFAMQSNLLKLGYKMISDKEYPPDGRYWTATANAVQAFKVDNEIPGDGDTFDADCVTAMLEMLHDLETGIGQEMYDEKVQELNSAVNTIGQLNNQLSILEIDNDRLVKIEQDHIDVKVAWSVLKDSLENNS